jgi:hypothetical protein
VKYVYTIYYFCVLIPDPYVATLYVKIIFSAMFVSWPLSSVCLVFLFLKHEGSLLKNETVPMQEIPLEGHDFQSILASPEGAHKQDYLKLG